MALLHKNIIAGLFLFLFFSCKEGNDNQETQTLSFGSVSVSDVTSESAKLSAAPNFSVTEVKETGFCWSRTSQNPAREKDDYKIITNEYSVFATEINNLEADMKYYASAYAVTDKGTEYSAVAQFTTLKRELTDGEKLLAAYKAPDYPDDYSPIAPWEQRNQWNLANVHDPTVEKSGDYFYMYQTDASYGNVHLGRGHFPYRRSKDLVYWEFMGMAMPETPAWVKDTLNSMRTRLGLAEIQNPVYGHWAPVVRKVGDKYRMYYCVIIDNYIETGKPNTAENFDNSWTEHAFIGLMETADLASNQWTDKGMVVCSATDRGKDWYRPNLNNWDGYFKWNAIDPTYIVNNQGEHHLIYGSWHSGIVALKLNAETGKPDQLGESWDAASLPDYGKRIYTRSGASRWQASEAPEIIYNEKTGYYYLFLAYDELSVAYNTRVCRSQNIEGPYLDYFGNSVSADGNNEVKPIVTHPYKFNSHSGWVGISHCCIFRDGDNWFYASQARLPANTNGNAFSNAIMMGHVRKIRWTDDGWPVVMPERYGAVPDVPVNESEIAGAYEIIVLKYAYRQQQTSTALTLNANKNATGALTGTWSYNADDKMITIGNQKFCVEREVDWEAAPRRHTIVFTGINAQGESVWGKKVD
ncbi:MAG: arabinan endo-1,5-alpha-L-arabinosidase [Tannerella sp.]|jgi:arabinan endo-1,5-alpha-L-arabinosidase|nr:arabinan endo-1,5-alpha-L-arabinosidase [Tannerella sp.]